MSKIVFYLTFVFVLFCIYKMTTLNIFTSFDMDTFRWFLSALLIGHFGNKLGVHMETFK